MHRCLDFSPRFCLQNDCDSEPCDLTGAQHGSSAAERDVLAGLIALGRCPDRSDCWQLRKMSKQVGVADKRRAAPSCRSAVANTAVARPLGPDDTYPGWMWEGKMRDPVCAQLSVCERTFFNTCAGSCARMNPCWTPTVCHHLFLLLNTCSIAQLFFF